MSKRSQSVLVAASVMLCGGVAVGLLVLGWYLLKSANSDSPTEPAAPNQIVPSDDRGAPGVTFTQQFGSPEDDTPQALVIASGIMYLAGETEGDLHGPNANPNNTLATPGAADARAGQTFGAEAAQDAYLERLSADGQRIAWGRQFGTPAYDAIRGLTSYANFVYAVGTTEGELDGEYQGFSDVFIRKYTNTGELVWSEQFGTPQVDEALWAVSDAERVCLGGGTVGRLTSAPKNGSEDIFVRCYNHDGQELWTLQFGTSKFEEALGATIDATGIYLVGATSGEIAAGQRVGNEDAWIGKISLDGELLFTRQFGTKATDFGHGIAVEDGRIYAVGRTEGRFPGLTSAGLTDAFIVSFQDDGQEPEWVDQFGTSHGDGAQDVEAYANGAFVIGTKNGKAEKHGAITNLEDGYLREYAPTGEVRSDIGIMTDAYDEPRAIFLTEGTVTVVGRTGGAFMGTNFGAWDEFLVRFDLVR